MGNPMNYTDPSGNIPIKYDPCDDLTNENSGVDKMLEAYGVEFEDAKPDDSWKWDDGVKYHFLLGIESTARKIAKLIGGSTFTAFKTIFGITPNDQMVLTAGNCPYCNDQGAFTYSPRDIRFATWSTTHGAMNGIRHRNHLVHEFGHAFNQRLVYTTSINAYTELGKYRRSNPGFPDRTPLNCEDGEDSCTGPNFGFASRQNVYTWQQSAVETDGEEFADQFLGWVFDTWAHNPEGDFRKKFMDDYMPCWIGKMTGLISGECNFENN